MKHFVTVNCESCQHEQEIECKNIAEFKTIKAVNCQNCNKPIYLNGYKREEETPLKKINVDDLNGLEQANFKVITVTIQEIDPIKFSQLCEDLIKSTNPDTMINYSITNVQVQTQRGIAFLYMVNLQYWGTEQEHKEWETELRRKALIIKP